MNHKNKLVKFQNLPRSELFVGRQEELSKLLDYLSDPNMRDWIFSVEGIGGIGKTSLVLEAAHLISQESSYEAVIWTSAKKIELGPEGPLSISQELIKSSEQDVLETIMEVLELSRPPIANNLSSEF